MKNNGLLISMERERFKILWAMQQKPYLLRSYKVGLCVLTAVIWLLGSSTSATSVSNGVSAGAVT